MERFVRVVLLKPAGESLKGKDGLWEEIDSILGLCLISRVRSSLRVITNYKIDSEKFEEICEALQHYGQVTELTDEEKRSLLEDYNILQRIDAARLE